MARRTGSADDAFLRRLGAVGPHLRPAGTTFARAFAALDGDDVDLICGAWLAGPLHRTQATAAHATDNRLPVAAADGKTLRGATGPDDTRPHLVALYRTDASAVLAIALFKLLGWTNIAAATDHTRDHRNDTLTILGTTQ